MFISYFYTQFFIFNFLSIISHFSFFITNFLSFIFLFQFFIFHFLYLIFYFILHFLFLFFLIFFLIYILIAYSFISSSPLFLPLRILPLSSLLRSFATYFFVSLTIFSSNLFLSSSLPCRSIPLFPSFLFLSPHILLYHNLFHHVIFYSILLYFIIFYFIISYLILSFSILFCSILSYSIIFNPILFYPFLFCSVLFCYMTGRAIKSQPYPLLCNKYIPELYNTDRYKSITLERSPIINIRMTKDIKCNSILPGSFNAQYSFNKDYGQNGTNGLYNYETCSTINGFCPQKIKKNVFCPCVSTTSSQECFSSSCPLTPTSTVSDDCEPFTAKEIGSCYCLKNLQLILSAAGFSGVYSLLSDKKNVCRTFTFNYIIAEGLIYAIVIFSTFLNMFLESCLVFLTQLESHTSVDKRQGSLSFKFFLAVYLNMTFTALIAYGNIPGLPKILVDTYIFQG